MTHCAGVTRSIASHCPALGATAGGVPDGCTRSLDRGAVRIVAIGVCGHDSQSRWLVRSSA